MSFAAPSESTECLDFFINHFKSNKNLPQFSGQTLFDLGNREDCIQDKNSTYYSLVTKTPFAFMSTGLCAPIYCTENELNENIISEILKNVDFFTQNIVVKDPNRYKINFKEENLIILIFFVLIIFLGSFYTIRKLFARIFKKSERKYERIDQKSLKKNMDINLVEAFSFEKNAYLLFKSDEKKNNLDFFHGIRALSLFYVIFGHEFLLRLNQSANPQDVMELLKTPVYLFACGGFFSVDVFYYLSGFFLAVVFNHHRKM